MDPRKRLESAYDKSLDYRSGFGMNGRGPRILVPEEDDAAGGTRTTAKGRSPVPAGMRAWNGFVEDKIEQARSEGFFQTVQGRGRPIKADDARANPYIKRPVFTTPPAENV